MKKKKLKTYKVTGYAIVRERIFATVKAANKEGAIEMAHEEYDTEQLLDYEEPELVNLEAREIKKE